MNGLFAGSRAIVGAVLVSLLGSTVGAAQAAETDFGFSSLELTALDDGIAMLDEGEKLDDEVLPLAQRYAPPPPRSRRYRPYRPYWNFRIVPPPIFAPGWFGLYFLGAPPPPPPQAREEQPEPARRSDFRHVNEYSLGVSAGGYYGAYADGYEYVDPGVRFTLRYRNTPVVGAELAVGSFGSNMRLDGQGSDARSDVPIQLSAVVHAFPRSPIQPYFLFGGTADVRTYAYVDSAGNFGDPYSEVRVGPHVGLGVELLVGDRMGITVDARRVLYTLVDRQVQDQTGQRDTMITGGLNFYF